MNRVTSNDMPDLKSKISRKQMMEQVMINLLKNAFDAFDNSPNPHILVVSYRDYECRERKSISSFILPIKLKNDTF